jgi:hypothetical protein
MTDTYPTTDNGSTEEKPKKVRVQTPPDPTVRQQVEIDKLYGGDQFVAIDTRGRRIIVTLLPEAAAQATKALSAFVKPTEARLAIIATVNPDQIETY